VSPLDGANDEEELAELESMLAEVSTTGAVTTHAATSVSSAPPPSMDDDLLADLENELDDMP